MEIRELEGKIRNMVPVFLRTYFRNVIRRVRNASN